MKIIYEKGDRVVELATGICSVVDKNVEGKLFFKEYRARFSREYFTLDSTEVMPIQHAITLISNRGELQAVIIVPHDLTHGTIFDEAQVVANSYNQRLGGDDVIYALTGDSLKQAIHYTNDPS